MLEEAQRWLRFSNEDLAPARVTFAGERWAATSFFCQQAVEKALKALVVVRNQEPPRLHDLVILGRRVDLPEGMRPGLALLTRAYVVARYPDAALEPGEGIDQEIAGQQIRLAEEIIAWVRSQSSTGT